MRFDDLYTQTQSASGNPFAPAWREAARSDSHGLERWLGTVSFKDCFLFEIYEALATDEEPPIPLLMREFERLLRCAEGVPSDPEIPGQLEAFALLHQSGPFKKHALELLSRSLGSPVPQMRRLSVYLLSDFASSNDLSVIGQIRTLVRSDTDWRVRYLAASTLRDIRLDDPKVSPPPQLRIGDRLRVAVLGTASAANISA